MKKILYAILSLILVASLVMAGCVPKQEETTPVQVTGRVLNLYAIDPITLDPAVSAELTSNQYVTQLFSGLLRLDDSLKPVADIAQEWQVSNDGKTYTFRLRKDVRFHSGRGVKATDFKYSWERAASPATKSLTATNFLGDIVGVKDVLAGKSKQISGIKVIDDYTFQVTIDAPRPYFLSKLTHPVASVVDEANVKSGNKWWHRPNGTGPFKLVKWEEEKELVLQRNELYYGKAAQLDFVDFQLWSGVPMNLYEEDKINATDVSLEYIDRVTDEAEPSYRELTISPELSLSFIGFNMTKPPFDDVNIRRAFAMAIDKDKLVSVVFRGSRERADGILPPGVPGFNESLVGLKYDLDKAKQLIKESKYGDVSRLPPITITTSGWGTQITKSLEAIVYEWRQNLGADVKVRQLEPDRFFYHLKEEKDEMFDTSWVADYPHPWDFLDVLFRSGVENNYGEHSNAEVDALLDKAGLELNEGLSLALYRQAEQKLVDDVACLPLWFGRNYTLVKPYVKGYKVSPLGLVDLSAVSIESR